MFKRIIWIKDVPSRFLNYNTVGLFKTLVEKVFELAGGLLVIALMLSTTEPKTALFTAIVIVFLLGRVTLYLLAYGYTIAQIKELIAKMATSIVLAVFGEGWYSYFVQHEKDNLIYTIVATFLLFLDVFGKKKEEKKS